jgi:integrase/recombinase XerD
VFGSWIGPPPGRLLVLDVTVGVLSCLVTAAAHRRYMTSTPHSSSTLSPRLANGEQTLLIAAAAYPSRFKALSRMHAESDLRALLSWCAERQLDPLAASRPQLELYVRWMQGIRRLKPSTTSRRMSIVAGFYRTAVIDGLIDHSPAEHVRRPHVPPESPTLGLTHLQLEAPLTAARQSLNRYDFALVCLLGLLGLRIFQATGLDVADLGEEHGHRVIRVLGKGGKTVLVPLPPAVGRALDQAVDNRTRGPILLNTRGVRMDRHAATRRLRALSQATGMRMPPLHPHISVRRSGSSVGSGALVRRRSLHS